MKTQPDKIFSGIFSLKYQYFMALRSSNLELVEGSAAIGQFLNKSFYVLTFILVPFTYNNCIFNLIQLKI